jgi:hypothetical protein
MFDTPEKLFSVLTDYRTGLQPTMTGYFSLNYVVASVSYDPNTRTLSTSDMVAFGSKPIPEYFRRGFLKQQCILTNRSVTDSDANFIFPSAFILDPKNRIGDLLQFAFSYDRNGNTIQSGFFDNALMVKTSENGGIIFTQNAVKYLSTAKPNLSETYFGIGFGYRFKKLDNFTPLLVVHSKGFTLNFSVSF